MAKSNLQSQTITKAFILERRHLEPYLSPYLDGGWKQDDLKLDSIHIDRETKTFTGYFTVTDAFMPGDGVFHFSVPIAFICIAQVAIVGACVDLDISRKPGEVYVREIDLKCSTMINRSEGIEVVLRLGRRFFLGQRVFYEGEINVCDGAFSGRGSFVIPLPSDFTPLTEQSI